MIHQSIKHLIHFYSEITQRQIQCVMRGPRLNADKFMLDDGKTNSPISSQSVRKESYNKTMYLNYSRSQTTDEENMIMNCFKGRLTLFLLRFSLYHLNIC